ncbi:WSSV094 [White spot syndrome virus]|uniref:WSSV094 n=1 Tax=White spot syndrome virus TaxID=342409 RepID=A0A2I6SBL2_9VIRU|nr:WSSV094 [White spot syndrome virus]
MQQEQMDPDTAIESRRSLTTFLNHPNTASMANVARAAVVQEEETQWACIFLPTFFTSLPSQHQTRHRHHRKRQLSFLCYTRSCYGSEPFKDSARLIVNNNNTGIDVLNDKSCNYLQVSMPSESSGLVTNTGCSSSSSSSSDTFKYVRRTIRL